LGRRKKRRRSGVTGLGVQKGEEDEEEEDKKEEGPRIAFSTTTNNELCTIRSIDQSTLFTFSLSVPTLPLFPSHSTTVPPTWGDWRVNPC
jgi:hypothetical protein